MTRHPMTPSRRKRARARTWTRWTVRLSKHGTAIMGLYYIQADAEPPAAEARNYGFNQAAPIRVRITEILKPPPRGGARRKKA